MDKSKIETIAVLPTFRMERSWEDAMAASVNKRVVNGLLTYGRCHTARKKWTIPRYLQLGKGAQKPDGPFWYRPNMGIAYRKAIHVESLSDDPQIIRNL